MVMPVAVMALQERKSCRIITRKYGGRRERWRGEGRESE
jgi:hypothetical protein